jgi:hypothetical protein
MQLYENWREIVRKAWSIRFMVLAGLLTGLEVVVPLMAGFLPHGLFAALAGLSTCAALIARLVAQKSV